MSRFVSLFPFDDELPKQQNHNISKLETNLYHPNNHLDEPLCEKFLFCANKVVDFLCLFGSLRVSALQ